MCLYPLTLALCIICLWMVHKSELKLLSCAFRSPYHILLSCWLSSCVTDFFSVSQRTSGSVGDPGPGGLPHLHPSLRCTGGRHQHQVSSDWRAPRQETRHPVQEGLSQEWQSMYPSTTFHPFSIFYTFSHFVSCSFSYLVVCMTTSYSFHSLLFKLFSFLTSSFLLLLSLSLLSSPSLLLHSLLFLSLRLCVWRPQSSWLTWSTRWCSTR